MRLAATPAALFSGAAAQGFMTPTAGYANVAAGGALPSTPAGLFVSRPGLMPSTPAGAANRMVPATPGAANRMAPGTPGPANPGSVPMVPQQPKPYKPPTPMFSDGSSAPLRHAPRRKRGTSERLPAPSTAAAVPVHWTTVAPGEAKPAAPQDPILAFRDWQKEQPRIIGITRVSQNSKREVLGALPTVKTTKEELKAKMEMGETAVATPMVYAGEETPAITLGAQHTPSVGAAASQPLTPSITGGMDTPMIQGPLVKEDQNPTPVVQAKGEETPLVPQLPTELLAELSKTEVNAPSGVGRDARLHIPVSGEETPQLNADTAAAEL